MKTESLKTPAELDPLFTSLLARSWFIRLAVAGCLIAALWVLILWAVSLP
jgi:hypothetical protein